MRAGGAAQNSVPFMSIPLPLGNLISALWTPSEGGKLRRDLLAPHVQWLHREGVTAVLALGSTGEFPHFEERERLEILGAVVEACGAMPVLANVSAVSPASARRMASEARRIGCAGVIILPPWYFKAGEDDLLEFFLHVADGTDLPVWLYNFPERTGNRFGPSVADRFAQRVRMGGLKHSGAEWELGRDFVAVGEARGFPVYIGAEPRALDGAAFGVAGLISGMANFIPRDLARLLGSDAEAAAVALRRVQAVGEALSAVPFPLDVAAGMEAAGWPQGEFKSKVSAGTMAAWRETVERLRPLVRGAA
jgi:4-hydroxy-tetrahydrodipicolinate synthase